MNLLLTEWKVRWLYHNIYDGFKCTKCNDIKYGELLYTVTYMPCPHYWFLWNKQTVEIGVKGGEIIIFYSFWLFLKNIKSRKIREVNITRKTETWFFTAGSFASKLNVAKKSKEPINQISLMGMCWLLHAARNLWYILTH